ncbi:MAG: NUMOD3 domain-containing DNA-binding protein [Candidatus Paceibacterota bacterium]
MFYTIYQTTNIINGKYYIGKHQTKKIDDTYLGSGKALVNAIKLHGKHNFKKEILHVFETEQEMNEKEKELVTEELVKNYNTYNIGIGGEGGPHFKGRKHSSKTIQILKNLNIGKLLSEETKKKISDCNKISNFSRALKVSLANKGKVNVGRIHSEETKKKISETLKRNWLHNSKAE